MFELHAINLSTRTRSSRRAVAVRGRRHDRAAARDPRLRPHRRANAVPFAVGAWIGGAYWFTSSTSFANPAVTIARTLSDSFAGIAPVVGADVHPHAARRRTHRLRADPLPLPGQPRRPPMTDPPPQGHRGAVRLRPQRRPIADGRGAARPPRRRPGRRPIRRHRTRRRPSTRPSSTRWPRSASTSPPAAPSRSELTDAAVQASDVVITMGCGDECPFYPGKRYLDWALDDPAGKGVDAVRPIRDEIERPRAPTHRRAPRPDLGVDGRTSVTNDDIGALRGRPRWRARHRSVGPSRDGPTERIRRGR